MDYLLFCFDVFEDCALDVGAYEWHILRQRMLQLLEKGTA